MFDLYLQYNAELLIINDAQAPDEDGNEVTHTLNQRFVTRNNEGEELLKIAQSRVDGTDGTYNLEEGAEPLANKVDERTGKDDVNALTFDCTEGAEKAEFAHPSPRILHPKKPSCSSW